MVKRLESGASYAGRRADVAVINCRLDREAATLLRHYSGSRKLGALVSWLVYEYHGRQQERTRVRQELAMVLGGEA